MTSTINYASVDQEEKKDPEEQLLCLEKGVTLNQTYTQKQFQKFVVLATIIALIIGGVIGFVVGFHGVASLNFGCCGEYFSYSNAGTEDLNLPPPSTRHWIFAELSAAEVRAVAAKAKLLLPGDVRTTMNADYSPDADYITGTSAVELIPPPKSAARAFLESDDDSVKPPPRYAKVTVARGSVDPPDVMEYKIGPLHGCDLGDCGSISLLSVGDEIEPLTKPGQISWAKRPYDMGEVSYFPLIQATLQPLSSLLFEKFGPIFDYGEDCSSDCPAHDPKAGSVTPFAFNDIESNSTNRISKMMFFWFEEDGYPDALWLHPLPFSFHIDQKNGGDVSSWIVYDLKLCTEGPFASPQELLDAVAADPSKFNCQGEIDIQGNVGYRGDWDVPGSPYDAPGRPKPKNSMPSRMVASPGENNGWASSTGGAINAAGRFVQWQDWSFYTTVRPSTGLAILDVTFKGKQIGYEMSLSEAMAAYSGSATDGDQVFYLDAAYSMSQLGGPLVKGVDCPYDAEYIEDIATMHVVPNKDGGLDSNVDKAIGVATVCIFEDDKADTLWRHTTLNTKESDGVRNSNFVVRHVTTVGNYDYITEFRFGLDGSIRIAFNFAGFCETRWYDALLTPEEGPRPHGSLSEVVKSNLVAPLHSHFGVFKLDLDVLGTSNTFEVIEAKSGFLDDVEGTKKYPTKYLDTTQISKEELGKSTRIVNPLQPTVWRIINRNTEVANAQDANARSRAPGYAILPGATIINTLPDDHPFVLAAAFSKYNLVVTKRHDDESRCTSIYDLYGPSEPTVSINDFIDGESIEDTDIVAWLSLGKEHVTRTEDLPLISSAFGVEATLLPWNIFEGHAGMDIPTEPTPTGCTVQL